MPTDRARRRSGRPFLGAAVLVAVTVIVTAAQSPLSSSAPTAVPNDLIDAACALPQPYLERIWRGSDPGRSGELLLVPTFPNFIGDLSHSGPWPYLQRIPMLWYGPGHIRPAGRVQRPVTLADVAATQAALLRFAPWTNGTPMHEALITGAQPPRLVVTIVWDGGGRDVLETWPRAWPELRRLIPRGTWFERAIVGSSPTVTPASHATLGTGVFPRTHGELDIDMRIGPTLAASGDNGVRLLVRPTFADLYDRALGNEPLVGAVATGAWHLNMMGHGSMWGGGDRDIAILKPSRIEASGPWQLPAQVRPFFSLPRYVNDEPSFAPYLADLDRADGRIDESWLDHPFRLLDDGFDTPARTPYQTELIEGVIEREGFGADDVPDLLFVNYKMLDFVGHRWSVNSREMRDTLRVQDAELGRLVKFLDRNVGRERWVLLLTADHGHQFDPALTGAFRISQGQLGLAIDDRFDDGDGIGVVETVHSTQVFLNVDELSDVGADVVDVARFLLAFTQSDGAEYGADAVDPDDRVFALAIPPALFDELPCLPR